MTRSLSWLCTGLGLAALGCGSAQPPKELVDARLVYQQAQQRAVQLAPAQLDTAKQALNQAEAAFEDQPSSDKTRALSYIADRKARLAIAAANTEAANRERAQSAAEYQKTEEELRKSTQADLSKTKDALRNREEAIRQKERELSHQKETYTGKLADREKALKDKDAALDAEKKARMDAEKRLEAAMASLAEVAKVKEESRGVVITLSGAVLFASGKSTLLPIAQDKLNQVAQALNDQGYKSLLVEGHTDSVGGDQKNQELSQARAEAVRSHLISRGIPSDKIRAMGIGEARPIADNNSAEGRANNRRVEIIVEPEKRR
jgi:outer membrane protein OmpA-like peptidoglycan-associated protein